MGAPADHADKEPTSTTALCFPKPDPLALALVLCMSAGPPALVVSFYLMLEELAASLVVNRPTSEPVPGCQPTLEVASLGIEEPSLALAAHSPQPSRGCNSPKMGQVGQNHGMGVMYCSRRAVG
jgi:hypothetical protein